MASYKTINNRLITNSNKINTNFNVYLETFERPEISYSGNITPININGGFNTYYNTGITDGLYVSYNKFNLSGTTGQGISYNNLSLFVGNTTKNLYRYKFGDKLSDLVFSFVSGITNVNKIDYDPNNKNFFVLSGTPSSGGDLYFINEETFPNTFTKLTGLSYTFSYNIDDNILYNIEYNSSVDTNTYFGYSGVSKTNYLKLNDLDITNLDNFPNTSSGVKSIYNLFNKQTYFFSNNYLHIIKNNKILNQINFNNNFTGNTSELSLDLKNGNIYFISGNKISYIDVNNNLNNLFTCTNTPQTFLYNNVKEYFYIQFTGYTGVYDKLGNELAKYNNSLKPLTFNETKGYSFFSDSINNKLIISDFSYIEKINNYSDFIYTNNSNITFSGSITNNNFQQLDLLLYKQINNEFVYEKTIKTLATSGFNTTILNSELTNADYLIKPILTYKSNVSYFDGMLINTYSVNNNYNSYNNVNKETDGFFKIITPPNKPTLVDSSIITEPNNEILNITENFTLNNSGNTLYLTKIPNGDIQLFSGNVLTNEYTIFENVITLTNTANSGDTFTAFYGSNNPELKYKTEIYNLSGTTAYSSDTTQQIWVSGNTYVLKLTNKIIGLPIIRLNNELLTNDKFYLYSDTQIGLRNLNITGTPKTLNIFYQTIKTSVGILTTKYPKIVINTNEENFDGNTLLIVKNSSGDTIFTDTRNWITNTNIYEFNVILTTGGTYNYYFINNKLYKSINGNSIFISTSGDTYSFTISNDDFNKILSEEFSEKTPNKTKTIFNTLNINFLSYGEDAPVDLGEGESEP